MKTGASQRMFRLNIDLHFTIKNPVIRQKGIAKKVYFNKFFLQLASDSDSMKRLAAANFIDIDVSDSTFQENLLGALKLTPEDQNNILLEVAEKSGTEIGRFFRYLLVDYNEKSIKPEPEWEPKNPPDGYWDKVRDVFFEALSSILGNFELDKAEFKEVSDGDKKNVKLKLFHTESATV